eukprot:CAMPEP_0198334322 /NCGR_PEP_ID=MMETSP1450-20131203/19540_1 /TAXON_ID=753684 ORGANISM="Madagascaria erythrocladiodes, Strain CCMP3234" /NCGR_SAMPLE_ID=MMETSP1450 /ASSEMBLY_ACC=CAM_ASM_001115 /LENGTH=109 /DNA_ID=CAMNT_0044038905 /DNA_START=121 /DNA_END=446 /DNA_ORIENTATION=-
MFVHKLKAAIVAEFPDVLCTWRASVEETGRFEVSVGGADGCERVLHSRIDGDGMVDSADKVAHILDGIAAYRRDADAHLAPPEAATPVISAASARARLLASALGGGGGG